MKADWRYDRIKALKTELNTIILAAKADTLTDEIVAHAVTVLNENRQAAVAAEKAKKAAELEQF